jgi:predicted flap endonuclease-1-like 5' DNA nuclease
MSRFSRILGYFSLGLGASLLIAYWLKREEHRHRQQAGLADAYPSHPDSEEPLIVLSQATLDAAEAHSPILTMLGDDLTQITGIGPKTAEALNAMGIQSFQALAESSPDELLEQLHHIRGISAEKVQMWIKQAAQLV